MRLLKTANGSANALEGYIQIGGTSALELPESDLVKFPPDGSKGGAYLIFVPEDSAVSARGGGDASAWFPLIGPAYWALAFDADEEIDLRSDAGTALSILRVKEVE